MAAEVKYEVEPLNITWPQGTRLDITITAPNDFPHDFQASGTVIRSTWRFDNSLGDVALQRSTAATGITVTGQRSYVMSADAPTMAGLGDPGANSRIYYDVELVPAGVEANAIRIAQGLITIVGEGTR